MKRCQFASHPLIREYFLPHSRHRSFSSYSLDCNALPSAFQRFGLKQRNIHHRGVSYPSLTAFSIDSSTFIPSPNHTHRIPKGPFLRIAGERAHAPDARRDPAAHVCHLRYPALLPDTGPSRCLFAKEWPDPLFKYFSNRMARDSSGKAM